MTTLSACHDPGIGTMSFGDQALRCRPADARRRRLAARCCLPSTLATSDTDLMSQRCQRDVRDRDDVRCRLRPSVDRRPAQPRGDDEDSVAPIREGMVARRDAAGDLADRRCRRRRTLRRNATSRCTMLGAAASLTMRRLSIRNSPSELRQPRQMTSGLIERAGSPRTRDDLVDPVGELIAAVLDVHRRTSRMRPTRSAVDIGVCRRHAAQLPALSGAARCRIRRAI